MPHSRSFFRAIWPLALVLVIAAGWSLYWYIGSEKAKDSFAKYLDKNRRAGIEIDCTGAAWSGFPFRFELTCSKLKVVSSKRALPFTLETGALHAVALAYNPFHLISEMQTPLTLTLQPGTADEVVISSQGAPLRTSARVKLSPRRADQVSLLATDQTGTVHHTGDPTAAPRPYTLERANLHSRFAEPPVAGVAPFDFALTVTDLVYGPDGTVLFGKEPLRVEEIELDGSITALPFKAGLNFAERAEKWQAGGGELSVRKLKSISNFLTGISSGAIALDGDGRLNGKLEWTVSGFDDLMARLRTAEIINEKAAAAADTLLTLLGKSDKDAEVPGLKLKTILKEGKLYFGPFRIAEIPPVF